MQGGGCNRHHSVLRFRKDTAVRLRLGQSHGLKHSVHCDLLSTKRNIQKKASNQLPHVYSKLVSRSNSKMLRLSKKHQHIFLNKIKSNPSLVHRPNYIFQSIS